uniref:Uncharacterized protein n=1 Tax=Tetraselmis sp. GSL018 TaxID=582737 RepID=A0A061SI03_9CHLO
MKSRVAMLQSDLEAKEEQLQQANASLRAATRHADTSSGAASKAAADLEDARSELESQRSSYEHKLSAMRKAFEEAQQKAEGLEQSLQERSTSYEALKRSTADDMQALQTETAALSREAARWREHHAFVKQQLDAKERELAHIRESSYANASDADAKVKQMSEELAELRKRLGQAQSELSEAKHEAEESARSYERRISQLQAEAKRLQEGASSTEQSLKTHKQSAASAQQELDLLKSSYEQAREELEHLQGQHAAAQDRIKGLRDELVSANTAHLREMEEKTQVVNDVLYAMQAEEKAKLSAMDEAQRARSRATELEAKLSVLERNLSSSVDSKRRTEDAFSAAQSALNSMKEKAGVYRKENKMLLSNYDAWIKTLMENSPERSPGSPGATSSPGRYFQQETGHRSRHDDERDAHDIQSYSDRLARMFESRKSYGSMRGSGR